ncbi:unnamed protein product [Mucor fragilis]
MTNETKKAPKLIGSQDLLTYFNLIPIYNKIVKPYPPPNRAAGLNPTLFPYISDLPGRMDMEPDDYLLRLLRDPQAVENGPDIRPLDAETLRDAFSLKEGPVPGFDASILGTDDTGNNSGGNGYISTYVGGGDQYGQSHGNQRIPAISVRNVDLNALVIRCRSWRKKAQEKGNFC